MRGEEVFEKLKRKNIFDVSSVGEAEKRRIFLNVWDRCFKDLRRNFDRRGFSRESEDNNGFGYLVEEFARQSSRIPRNTSKGNQIADLLLSFLRNGDEFGLVGFKGRLHNPDSLGITISGRRVVITGIIEVKASAETLRSRLNSQIANQENNVRKLAAVIEDKKQLGSVHSFFQKRKIIVAEKLLKLVAVPAGEGSKVRVFLPKDWECIEIEFSHNELVFIAQIIWPEFTIRETSQSVFSEGYIVRFEREFLALLVDFAKSRFQKILCDSSLKNIPAKEILLAISCLGRIPLLDNDINWIADYLNRRKLYGLFPTHIDPVEKLNKKEGELFDKLVKWYLDLRPGQEKIAREHALFFLSNVSCFLKVLNTELKKDVESSARLGRMDGYDLASFLG